MLKSHDVAVLCGQLSEHVGIARECLSGLLAAYEDKDTMQRLKFVSYAYTCAIIINLGKVFTTSSNEHYRLQRFREIESKNINERIDRLYERHGDLIAKINKNRDWLFAHTDPRFPSLLFSAKEVERMEKLFDTDFQRLRAKTRQEERYAAIDVAHDADEIRDLLFQLDEIWNEAIVTEQ